MRSVGDRSRLSPIREGFDLGSYGIVQQCRRDTVSRSDDQRDYFSLAGQDHVTNLGHATTTYIWGGGRLADGWPGARDEDEYRHVTSNVETLLIGGELDFSTPPQVASKELLPYLPNGQEVVLPAIGHTGTFFAVQPEAVAG